MGLRTVKRTFRIKIEGTLIGVTEAGGQFDCEAGGQFDCKAEMQFVPTAMVDLFKN